MLFTRPTAGGSPIPQPKLPAQTARFQLLATVLNGTPASPADPIICHSPRAELRTPSMAQGTSPTGDQNGKEGT